MKQLFQNLKTGEVLTQDLPLPFAGPGQVVIKTSRSLVSLGTEKMLLDFGKAGWLEKAKQQPEKVQQVLSKIKTDGLVPTLDAVKRKLDQPLPLGYSAVGTVVEVGRGVTDLNIGDRVVSNGPHAEYVVVSRNLVSKIPEKVSDEDAAFTVVSAIGLQGIRLLSPTYGETVVVIGLGLIGLLTVQILIANGCSVIGFDLDETKVALAKKFGAKAYVPGGVVDPVQETLSLTHGLGVDGVIITASTSSDEIISQAAQMTRKRGRVILVGVIGLSLKRSDFYEKEISFQVSCSYGPGRYDPLYEEKGLDYPVGFVRWTEQRNFDAVLKALELGQINVKELITNRVSLENAPQLYSELGSGKAEMGIVIEYGKPAELRRTIELYPQKVNVSNSSNTVSFLGAGQFAGAVLLPAFKKNGFSFGYLGSRSGALGAYLAKKYEFSKLSSDYDEIINNDEVKNVVIVTRHSSHGSLVLKALQAGKNVFVEKPLCLLKEEVEQIESFFREKKQSAPLLMVGFNRRFSPLATEVKKHIDKVNLSKAYVMTVNAGFLPDNHWTQDPEIGGGRLVGEGCHFIDLLRYLSGSPIVDASVVSMNANCPDTYSIQLKFKNGDIGTIHYFANGNKEFPKERLEVFVGGKIIIVDNFRSVKGLGLKGLKYTLASQDKGHHDEIASFAQAIKNGIQPVPIDEVLEVSRWAIRLQGELFSKHGKAE